MDKATVIEHALDLLGEHDFAENSSTHSIAMRHYNTTLRECCAAHHWSFARRTRTLAESDHGSNTFHLPVDCLRIKHLCEPNTDTPYPRRVNHWQLNGRTITASGYDSLTLTYTADFTASGEELPDAAPLFQQYAIHLLASRLAPTICGTERGVQLAQYLIGVANQYRHDAMVADAQQDNSNDQNYLPRILMDTENLNNYIR